MTWNFPSRLRQRLRAWRYHEAVRWHLAYFPSRRVRQRIRAWRARLAHPSAQPIPSAEDPTDRG